MIDWSHAWPSVTTAFLASLVEFVEALTIVLAVGAVRGWRHALIGAAGGAIFLTVLVIAFGPLLHRFPITTLQVVVGVLLCMFGMRWLRKAALRAAGIIGMHDEDAIYKKQTQKLAGDKRVESLDMVAAATSFKAVTIEGLEVVFIVIATGALGNTLIPAAIGALAAGILVIVLGLVIHKPLSRVPENSLKFAVGVLLAAFGVFWVGEGMGFRWPGEDLAILALAVGFTAIAFLSAWLAKRGAARIPARTAGESH